MTRREVLQEVESKARDLGGIAFFQWLHTEAEKPESDGEAREQENALTELLLFLAAPERTPGEIAETLDGVRENLAQAARAAP